jgi:hypothetical protein
MIGRVYNGGRGGCEGKRPNSRTNAMAPNFAGEKKAILMRVKE